MFLGFVSVLILGNCVMKARVKIIVRETINFGCPTENSTRENFRICQSAPITRACSPARRATTPAWSTGMAYAPGLSPRQAGASARAGGAGGGRGGGKICGGDEAAAPAPKEPVEPGPGLAG